MNTEKIAYQITANNNELSLFEAEKNAKLYHSFWYMDFGKTCAEVKNAENKLVYDITKKFQFWKWRMVYHIKKSVRDISFLISQNSRNTIFKMELLDGVYEIKVHYLKKKSIYKNNTKIAEFDEAKAEENKIDLLVLEDTDLGIIFLLYVCLLIGINDFKSNSVLKSQKRLEKNLEPWF